MRGVGNELPTLILCCFHFVAMTFGFRNFALKQPENHFGSIFRLPKSTPFMGFHRLAVFNVMHRFIAEMFGKAAHGEHRRIG